MNIRVSAEGLFGYNQYSVHESIVLKVNVIHHNRLALKEVSWCILTECTSIGTEEDASETIGATHNIEIRRRD
jgi:hypothetical protein